MNENYIMINGSRIDLTEEQIKKLSLSIKEDYFKKGEPKTKYYFISDTGKVYLSKETNADIDKSKSKNLYDVANYCTNESIMAQRALHETLNRLLWRFSMQNNGDKINWDNSSIKYHIGYDYTIKNFYIGTKTTCKNNQIYFIEKEIAQNAINEIILPFIKEHPEFIW